MAQASKMIMQIPRSILNTQWTDLPMLSTLSQFHSGSWQSHREKERIRERKLETEKEAEGGGGFAHYFWEQLLRKLLEIGVEIEVERNSLLCSKTENKYICNINN